MKKLVLIGVMTSALALGSAPAFAASNPAGTGQPGVECGEDGAELGPHGFATSGFANAETHYADTDGTHAVSQYDVACYQFTQSHSE